MTCALCLREAKLRNSHVIPEFMYTPLYDDQHRFHVLSAPDIRRKRKYQKGLREKLLCGECESQLAKHERYVSLVFNGGNPVQSQRQGQVVRVEGIGYKQFKLFGLSILWRAGASSLDFFKNVSLGPHEEPIRLMVLNDDPGRPGTYGFFLAPLVLKDNDIKDLMVQPTHARVDGHLCFRFVFGGLIWVFVVSGHPVRKNLRQAFINEKGELLMLVSELQEVGFIVNAMKRIGEHQ